MRFSKITLLIAGVLLLSASNADAYALNMTLNPGSADPSIPVPVGYSIIVDVYLDAPTPGLEFLGVALLYDDDDLNGSEAGNGDLLKYDNDPISATSASSTPVYILYDYDSVSKVASRIDPVTSPPIPWNGFNQAGKLQVNPEYYEPTFGVVPSTGTGNNIWIATLVFDIVSVADGTSTIDLALLTNGSTIVQANSITYNGVGFQGTVPVTGQVIVPEPSAVLAGIAAVSAVLLLRGRRRKA